MIVVLLQGVVFLRAPKPGNTEDAKKQFTDSLATALDYSLQDKRVDLLTRLDFSLIDSLPVCGR
jgi:hypothetical protein